MADRSGRESAWILIALALVLVVGWVTMMLIGSASRTR